MSTPTPPQLPVIAKPVPAFEATEGASFGPFDLTDYIVSPDGSVGTVSYFVELTSGEALPTGLVCTQAGLFGGRPQKGSAGDLEINLIAMFDNGDPLIVQTTLSIKPGIAADDPDQFAALKNQVWEALGKNQPPPNFADALNRPITPAELYYLLQRFASLSIWDVYNLEHANEKVLLTLPDSSPHYNIYDRGSCLVGAPKDLFSTQRTLADALLTAKVMAREVFKRGWTIEFSGFNKMARAAWVELQVLGNQNNKQIEILHYIQGPNDQKLFADQLQAVSLNPMKSM